MTNNPYTFINFSDVEKKCLLFADCIKNNYVDLKNILLQYESHEVATDEISRTLDLLENISENKDYFQLRVRSVTSFLPRNQPLYALSCFVLVPSLMASEVHFRIPHTMHGFFEEMLSLLNVTVHFPNINISSKERLEFLRERSALLIDPISNETTPLTDVVIFTGTSTHADQLRLIFDRKTLFITNGAGHNPLIVADNAIIDDAVEAVLSVSLYNQGQDCAAPNSILVHKACYEDFMRVLRDELAKIKVGPYFDESCRVGPISNPNDLSRIASIIAVNRQWLDDSTDGIINIKEAIVEPTIICKPLNEGINHDESFAPIIFIQKYDTDTDLATYFENPNYASNAMYITLYGDSKFIYNIIGRPVKGKILHYKDTFLHNTHLHKKGVERGVRPYGGYGRGASSLSIDGKVLSIPTLPQRDIFEWVVKPIIENGNIEILIDNNLRFTKLEHKNVEKILKMKVLKNDLIEETYVSDSMYFDLDLLRSEKKRYAKIEQTGIYHIIDKINADHVSKLSLDDLRHIRALKFLVESKKNYSLDDFTSTIYSIPKETNATEEENKAKQSIFFKNVYQLLFKKDRGPKLAQFLWEIDEGVINSLLDV